MEAIYRERRYRLNQRKQVDAFFLFLRLHVCTHMHKEVCGYFRLRRNRSEYTGIRLSTKKYDFVETVDCVIKIAYT